MADILVLDGLVAGYGEAVVLHGMSLSLGEGRSLAVLGRNGTGKTTLIDSIIGQTRHFAGTIVFRGRDITADGPEARAAAGIGWVPQERNIFRSLTVEENLTAVERPGPWTLDRVYALFPGLLIRRMNLGGQLSGGEQQMLAVARALMLNPSLLLLDEPLEGLAPIIVDELLKTIRTLVRDEGLSTILVEQKARKVLAMTDDAVILDRGTIVHAAPSHTLLDDDAMLAQHLGVAGRRRSHRSDLPRGDADA